MKIPTIRSLRLMFGTLLLSLTFGCSGDNASFVASTALVSITVTSPNPSTAIGTNVQFTATGTYSDNTKADLTQATGLTWSSSNPLIATIANRPPPKNAGLATLVSAGTVTITATAQQGTVIGTTTLTITP